MKGIKISSKNTPWYTATVNIRYTKHVLKKFRDLEVLVRGTTYENAV